jgi:hypothetical protein
VIRIEVSKAEGRVGKRNESDKEKFRNIFTPNLEGRANVARSKRGEEQTETSGRGSETEDRKAKRKK